MDSSELRSQIESIASLPTIPSVLKNILKVIENPKISLNELGAFVSTDPVLVSRVLKVVNSPIYGFSGRISSVSQALLLLGLNVVRGMLFGVSVFEVMEKSMLGLWGHSMGCAVTAKIIAKRKDIAEPEEVSVAALLHDIGKVALSLKFPDEYKKTLTETTEKDLFIFEAEDSHFNITHANSGAWIAERWNFPKNLVEVIGYHHKPHLSKNVPLHTAIVHVSDILIRAKGFGFAGDNHVPPINQAAWEMLEFTEKDLREILVEMDDGLMNSEDFMSFDE